MKRPSDDDDDDRRSSSSDSKLEAFLWGFLERHPRFFLYVGIGLAVLVITVVVATKLATKSQ
jgi:hypothetical protein